MKVIAINGSPRKGGNTELLVDQVIDGCRSKIDTNAEKIDILEKNIEYCKGCLTCISPPPGTGKCIIEDDMAAILESMKESDIFIFGTPNHMRTITAPLLNFLSRMLPLLIYRPKYDDKGKIVGGEGSSKIGGKKVAIVISQGEPFFCSSLVYEVLLNNLKDFRLTSVGNIISMGNIEKGEVAKREEDLKKAFDLGVNLATLGS